MRLLFGLLLATALAGPVARAQSPTSNMDGAAGQSNLRDLVRGMPVLLPTGSSTRVKGTPYADPRWLPARLQLTDSRTRPQVMLKYDVLGRRLLMRTQANGRPDSLQLDDGRVAGFVLEEPATGAGPGRSRVFRRFSDAPDALKRTGYVEVLHQGRYTLLLHLSKKLVGADFQGAYSSGRLDDEIENHPAYYLLGDDGAPQPVNLTLRALQKAAPGLAAPLRAACQAQPPQTAADWAAALDRTDPPVPAR